MYEQEGPRASSVARWGAYSWNLVGMGLVAVGVVVVAGTLSTLVVPLTVAVVVGMLGTPAVEWMATRGVARSLGAAVVLVALVAAAAGAVAVTVRGVADQAGEIEAQMVNALEWFDEQIARIDDSAGTVSDGADQFDALFTGVAGALPDLVSSVGAILFGTFIALFFMFYMLKDWPSIRRYLGGRLGLPPDVARGAIDDATNAIRVYFFALTISSICTAILIGGAMWALGLPLAFAVAVVTFVTSYVPYLGAIFSGAFASLVALGSGGLQDAVIVLVVVLVAQNVVQTVAQTRLSSELLSIHPIVNLGSTIVGASLAGLLGATLSAPVVAMVIMIRRRVAAAHEGAAHDAPGPEPGTADAVDT